MHAHALRRQLLRLLCILFHHSGKNGADDRPRSCTALRPQRPRRCVSTGFHHIRKRVSPELLSAGRRALPRFVRGRLRLTTDCSVRCCRTSAKSESAWARMELTAGFAPAMSTLPRWCIALYAWSAKWGSDWIRTSVKRLMKPLPYSSSHGTVKWWRRRIGCPRPTG